jgi:hypothetical protein
MCRIRVFSVTLARLTSTLNAALPEHQWHDFLEDCVIHGYNTKRFDVPLLRCAGGIHFARAVSF